MLRHHRAPFAPCVAFAGGLLLMPSAGHALSTPAAGPGPGALTPDSVDAREVLRTGLEEAAETDRLVFLHSGAPWCGWCRRLEEWLRREDIEPIFSRDFVDVKIDIEEMKGGEALMDSYTGGYKGVPFLVILKPDGTVVVDSFAADGRNIGSPRAEWEIEYWNEMMRASVRRITEEEIEYMAETLAEDRPRGGQ